MDFPLHDSFFPQVVLTTDEVKYYKRLGKDRVAQLVRIIDDAECAYKWSDIRTSGGNHCQRAQFLDFRPVSKATYASVLLKASIQLTDVRPEEILQAVARQKTKDFRKGMRYVHGNSFVDGRTLLTLPSSSSAGYRPTYSYRAIKWHAFKRKYRDDNKTLDFCYLEYTGRKKPHAGSSVVGFCIQESIPREREVPNLENFGVLRGYLSRTGILISKTHQANVLRVTSICQVDGDLNPAVRNVLEDIMQEYVCSIFRVKELIDRQRVSSLRFLEQWQWIPNSDRKACAVCLRGFYFHRKHHCRTCGEVVCSSCAPLRELEEPIFDITQLRVCSVCMINAGNREQMHDSGQNGTSTSNGDTESYIRGLRSPQHNSYEEIMFQMRDNRDRERRSSSDVAPPKAPERTSRESLPAGGRFRHKSLSQPQEKIEALTNVVGHIRSLRDTINLSISDAEFPMAEDQEIHSQRSKIRDTLEESVHNFDAALANATGVPVYSSRGKPLRGSSSLSSGRNGGSSAHARNIDTMTPEQFASVAKITFAAARATKKAGEAFLSSVTSDVDRQSDIDGSVTSASARSDLSRDPYSSSNYERVMANLPANEDSALDISFDDDKSYASSIEKKSFEINRLEQKLKALQRSLVSAQEKISIYDADEPDPELGSSLDSVPLESAQFEIESVFEVFGDRSESSSTDLSPRLAAARAEKTRRAFTTHDLVSELRGVMNSSEVTTPIARLSCTKSPTPSHEGNAKQLPVPPQMKSLYVSERGRLVSSSSPAPSSTGKPAKEFRLDSTGSSSASYVHALADTSYASSRGFFPGARTAKTDSDVATSVYQQLMADNAVEPLDDEYDSSDESDHDTCVHLLDDQKLLFGRQDSDEPFLTSDLLRELPDSRRNTLAVMDESEELRRLMAGLSRPRSSSMPFRRGSDYGRTPSNQQYEKPTWSDDGAPTLQNPAEHHLNETAMEVRGCLASFRCECPSEWERERKLSSIFRVLRSLHREGTRSKFRSLHHEDIRYAKVLRETPSIIKLLKLSGYVSLPDKLTMRRVDPMYLAIFLREIQLELRHG